MPNGYRRGGTVRRGSTVYQRRGTRIKAPSTLLLAAGLGLGAAALFGTGSALTLGVASVGIGALFAWRYRRQLRPVTRRLERWAGRRMSKRNTRPMLVARTPRVRHDVFDPRDGTTLRTVRSEAAAKRVTKRQPELDYAPEGEGW